MSVKNLNSPIAIFCIVTRVRAGASKKIVLVHVLTGSVQIED